MRNIKNIENMKNIKKIHQLKACAVGVLLSVSMQNSHASGVPTIDGAVLGNGIQEFISQTAEHAEEAARWIATKVEWAERLKNWQKDLAVATEGFSMIQDLATIYNAAGDVMNIATDIKEAANDLRENGLEGVAKDAFNSFKVTLYKNRSPEIQESCSAKHFLKKELAKLTKEYEKKMDKGSGIFSSLVSKVTATTSATKAQSVSVGMADATAKLQKQREAYLDARTVYTDKITEAQRECEIAIANESVNVKQDASFATGGGGMSMKENSSAASSGSSSSDSSRNSGKTDGMF